MIYSIFPFICSKLQLDFVDYAILLSKMPEKINNDFFKYGYDQVVFS